MAAAPRTTPDGSELDPFDVGACLELATKAIGARRRPDASIGSEFLFIATPAFFEREPGIDLEKGEDAAAPRVDFDSKALQTHLAEWRVRNGWTSAFLPSVGKPDEDGTQDGAPLPSETGTLSHRWQRALEAGDDETRAWLQRFDLDRVLAWVAAIVLALDKKPGIELASLRLDLDETTPHLSAFVVPSYLKTTTYKCERWVSIRTHFDKKIQLSQLQDWAGEVSARPVHARSGDRPDRRGREDVGGPKYEILGSR